MAVYYNESYIDTEYLFTCDGGTYSANLSTSTAFDLFPDDAAIDDAIYFGRIKEFKNIKFYVGTAFAATSVTFVWEYYDGSSWQTLSVTDNTNGFTNLGENEVTWNVPHDWDHGPVINSIYMVYWVRCRISAINTPTEGGAQSTQKVTIGNNVLRLNSSYSLATLLTAITSAGYGDILYNSHSSLMSYKFSCSVQMDTGGVITDSYKTLIFKKEETPFLATTGTLTLSKCLVYFYSKFSTTYVNKPFTIQGVTNFDACIIYWVRSGSGHSPFNIYGSGTWNMTTMTSSMADGAYYFYTTSHVFTDVEFEMNSIYPTNWSTPPIRLKVVRLVFNGGIQNGTIYQLNNTGSLAATQSGGHWYLRDMVACSFPSTVKGTWHFHKQWYFGLKVTNGNFEAISGASVVIIDYTGATILDTTTDVNGEITGLYLDERVYESSGGWDESSPLINNAKTPHTVTISKSGYITKTIKYTMDRKREEVEVLEKVKDLNFSKKGRFITQ
jgi:hypothetical protein